MKHRAVFITATDTGVGKTMVTALLLAYLRSRGIRAAALKPVSSGDRGDARLLKALMDDELSLDAINPVHFRHPLAPLVAARREKKKWHLCIVKSAIRDSQSAMEFVLVEGIGGLLVPLKPGYSVRDLVRELKLPLLVVARPGLGTINHTALTVEAARRAGIEVLGVVLNNAIDGLHDLAERTNAGAIEETCRVKVVARFPHLPRLRPTAEAIRSALHHPLVRTALRSLVHCVQNS